MLDEPTPVKNELDEIVYNIDAAYSFYRNFIYNEKHQALLTEHGFHIPGSIASVNWEVFASILTGDKGKLGYGSDLVNHEVKSSIEGGSFEYQYHLNGGKTKLLDDMQVNHIFVSYSADYKNIEVRIVSGKLLKDIFTSWMPGLVANYEGPNRRQRYRKSIAYGFVKSNGTLILATKNGDLFQTV